MPAAGLVAAAFRHRTSRAGDPQLHTHVLVANLGRGPDGRWSALDGRRLYAHARAASFVYQAVLRAELTRTLGLEWLPVRNGIAELVGVPKPVLRAFSRRRAEIQAALARARDVGPARRRSRGAGDPAGQTRASSRSMSWSRTGGPAQSSSASTTASVERLLGRVHAPALDDAVWQRIFAELASPTGLTQRVSTFSRRDVFQALCERLPAGAQVDARAIEAATDRFLASPHAVALLPAHGEGEAYRRSDGRLLPIERDELVYSTPELLALEQRLIRQVAASRQRRRRCDRRVGGASCGRVTADALSRAAADGRAAVPGRRRRERGGRQGRDGQDVRARRRPRGMAGRRLPGARRGGRPPRRTRARTRRRDPQHERRRAARRPRHTGALPERCVLVVDEAGMVPTRQLAQLIDAAAAVGGKLVLVGDHRQLPELEAGGAFRGLVNRGLAIELTENHRQVNPWERAALDELRDGRAEQALARYQAHDRIHVESTPERSRARLVADWWAAGISRGR